MAESDDVDDTPSSFRQTVFNPNPEQLPKPTLIKEVKQ
jgi:hypothetical protein